MDGEKHRLLLGTGWEEIEPVKTSWKIIFRDNMSDLRILDTDFTETSVIGNIGGLNCPIALNSAKGLAYYPVCDTWAADPSDRKRPGSWFESNWLEELDIVRSSRRVVCKAPKSFSFNWLLSLSPGGDRLLAYMYGPIVSGKMPAYLVHIDASSGNVVRKVELPPGAFHPSDVSWEFERVLFSGFRVGVGLVGFDGVVIEPAGEQGKYFAGNGSINHVTGDVAFDCYSGMYLWHIVTGEVDMMAKNGQRPSWMADRRGLWFSDDDSSLLRLNLANRMVEEIVRMEGAAYASSNFGVPITQTNDGRYLLVALSRKRKPTESEVHSAHPGPDVVIVDGVRHVRQGEDGVSGWRWDHVTCIVDTVEKKLWQVPSYISNNAWVTAKSPR